MAGLASGYLSEAQATEPAVGSIVPHQLAIALEFFRAGRDDEAQEIYAAILANSPDQFVCLHHLGLIAHRRGDHAVAERLIERAVAVKPDYVEAHSNLNAIYRAMGKTESALAAARRAVELDPNFAQAHSNLGAALEDQGQLEAALAAYRRAAALNPSFVEAQSNAANVLRKLGRPDEAMETCSSVIAQRPDAAAPYFSLGNILKEMRRPNQAIEAYRRAIALQPDFAQVYVNLGNVLQSQENFEEAVDAYREALALRPTLAEAHVNLGAALDELGRLDEAIQSFRAGLELDPKLIAVRAWLHHKRRLICDWTGIDAEEAELRASMERDPTPVHPFAILGTRATAAEQLRNSRNYAASVARGAKPFAPSTTEPASGRKLRIGYLSADFCRHATALLAVELFEHCDSSRFEITAYSHGPDDRSEMSARLRAAFDHFVDLRALSDDEAAARIRADKIDILIEMKGYTKGARTGISARRPAPVQASFLGFPGTMGADFIDYVIADPFVLPLDQQEAFSEKIVHLPHCYQPNDARRLIADLTPTRGECGLPEDGFVFCSFNNSYKITPEFFDIWMRLLTNVPGGVLWLLDTNDLAKRNLVREAAARGVDPDRLVFAPKLASPEHLARHRLADLFLDTLPYNAHTTASDALWAGLPVLTCVGHTFAGRVAGSLLHAVGLPELATASPAAYESLALRLAREPDLLQGVRHRLIGNRLNSPLFDAAAYTRDFEAALENMWRIFEQKREPRAFAIAAAPETPVATAKIQRLAYLSCPLCDHADIPAIINADCSKHPIYHPALPPVMTWRECQSCGHVFTDGYFDDGACELIFAKTQPNQTVGFDMERQRLVSARVVERIARHVAPGGHWLDVGFGSGSLLFAAEEWGYVPVGLDLRKDNVQALIGLGYEAHSLSIEELEHDERFSVVSMADVLEHMPFPKAGLAAARRLLLPQGALFLSMPNMDNMVWRLLHANNVNPYWGEIEHYHNFTRQRLYHLLEEHGFTPAAYHVSERYRVCMEVVAIKQG
ncbi:tetratricopeptide repeat protein [Methylocapsa acidiphila]|uniref:O-linked N-acetylglucosamine transferase family protein n=1 Tax=Methylocapsa acidiphila TaxID=133552 RepID=UPI00055D8726|nr:tetratricopeptide repeat protein [Methylocapsa acidiphila]